MMKVARQLKITGIFTLISATVVQSAIASTTLVTDAIGTQELWTFEEVLGAQKLVSRINQTDSKGISQTFDANGNLLSRTDAEGRLTTYTYNNTTNQRLTMTEAVGTPEERITSYEYVSDDIDLVTTTTSSSVFPGSNKQMINTYDAELNVMAITVNGFDTLGVAVSRITGFTYDLFGKVTQIDGPRTDVVDTTTLEYYDCSTGVECGQLKQVTNALGHISTFDTYDAASRLLQSTDANGVVTSYTYHPRGWLLNITQTPPTGAVRITTWEYDNVGQLIKVTLPEGTEQNFVYDAAHDLREISDNLDNKIEYTYDAKGNRTNELIMDPDDTLVRSTITAYDIRNHIESINAAGSITQMINDAVGNLSAQTDPNLNPSTNHSYDALDRLTNTVDALTNNTAYQYNVADQLSQAQAPNGATTTYEYDDLGNQTKETSPDRGTLVYTHDDAGNLLSVTDDRSITVTHQYDALNRVTSTTYPDNNENITYVYDAVVGCGNSVGKLCQINDESGQTNFEYDPWGNIVTQTKVELGDSYVTSYQYDAENRVVQMTYPNGRIVDYQRDAIGRIQNVDTTLNTTTTDVVSNRTYRADNLLTGQLLGNGLQETRIYDLQSRVTNIDLGAEMNWVYGYDPNGNILQIDSPQFVGDLGFETESVGYTYQTNSNRLIRIDGVDIIHDEVGNTLNTPEDFTFTYSDSNRLRTVSQEPGSVLQATYRYNALNQRTRKELPGSSTQVFHYDLGGNLILRTTGDGTPVEDYIWVDNELTQFTELSGGTEVKVFVTNDHLATPRLGTDDTQTITWEWVADAFNRSLPNPDPDADGTDVDLKIGFPGQYRDAESGLYYNWNRYYDPNTGRYVTSDPIGLLGGLNTYGYVFNNPIRFVDPDGRIPVPLITGAIVGFTTGVGAAAAGLPASQVIGAAVGGFLGGALLGAGVPVVSGGLLPTLAQPVGGSLGRVAAAVLGELIGQSASGLNAVGDALGAEPAPKNDLPEDCN